MYISKVLPQGFEIFKSLWPNLCQICSYSFLPISLRSLPKTATNKALVDANPVRDSMYPPVAAPILSLLLFPMVYTNCQIMTYKHDQHLSLPLEKDISFWTIVKTTGLRVILCAFPGEWMDEWESGDGGECQEHSLWQESQWLLPHTMRISLLHRQVKKDSTNLVRWFNCKKDTRLLIS